VVVDEVGGLGVVGVDLTAIKRASWRVIIVLVFGYIDGGTRALR